MRDNDVIYAIFMVLRKNLPLKGQPPPLPEEQQEFRISRNGRTGRKGIMAVFAKYQELMVSVVLASPKFLSFQRRG